ncbi:nitrate- and nitrite sensing domain-containing protein [Stutzerimonas tarimensis]|uniref:Nitrate- and nitrite sensing domain-containing protein n=1 Tax=Stutzerimonas tarimensis TaxID=1507735 RepID=A0ABV7T3Z0_9GAMM
MTDRKLPATLRFMLAARRSELLGLEDLTRTCELVTQVSRLVHALQKERGYSNIYLSGTGPHHLQKLDSLSLEVDRLEREVRESLECMDLESIHSADKTRLFSRIAYALYSLDELPALRRAVREQRISMQEATTTLVRLIGGLLSVVFEAADTAADPDITRALVALFNFMQGKELAGQERALGVAGFASGYFDSERLERMQQLMDAQERCFATFSRFAENEALDRWHALCQGEISQQVAQLREVAQRTRDDSRVDTSLCELWFELQTQRVDEMKEVEAQLEWDLLEHCRRSMERINADLHNHRPLLDRLSHMHAAAENAMLFSIQAREMDAPPEDGMTGSVERSTLELLQLQTQRLQRVNDELKEARQALNERKLIERAKKLLMDQYGLSESDAHSRLRQAAMDQGIRMDELAQRLLANAANDKPPRQGQSRPRARRG